MFELFTKGLKTEIELFIIDHNFAVNIVFYCINLKNLNFAQQVQNLQKNDDENDKQFVQFKKFKINEALFDQSLNKYLR